MLFCLHDVFRNLSLLSLPDEFSHTFRSRRLSSWFYYDIPWQYGHLLLLNFLIWFEFWESIKFIRLFASRTSLTIKKSWLRNHSIGRHFSMLLSHFIGTIVCRLDSFWYCRPWWFLDLSCRVLTLRTKVLPESFFVSSFASWWFINDTSEIIFISFFDIELLNRKVFNVWLIFQKLSFSLLFYIFHFRISAIHSVIALNYIS